MTARCLGFQSEFWPDRCHRFISRFQRVTLFLKRYKFHLIHKHKNRVAWEYKLSGYPIFFCFCYVFVPMSNSFWLGVPHVHSVGILHASKERLRAHKSLHCCLVSEYKVRYVRVEFAL